MYSGLTIANYIINWYNNMNKPIYNIRLQNLLYLIQGDYYNITKTRLIGDEFCIRYIGPVIPSVHEKFNLSCTLSNGIEMQPAPQLPVRVSNVLNRLLTTYFDQNTFVLSERAMSGYAYSHNLYISGAGSVIPFSDIISNTDISHKKIV